MAFTSMKKLSLLMLIVLIASTAVATPPNQVLLPVPQRTWVQRFVNAVKRSMPGAEEKYKINFVYLVPSDREERAVEAIKQTALNLQRFYRWQMGNGKTFTLTDPIVSVYRTDHDAAWYAWNKPEGVIDYRQWFWLNALHDLQAYAGGGFYQEFNAWICYVDADTRPGQAGGGTSGNCGDRPCFAGCAVMASTDIAGIMGLTPPGQQCRWFGGSGHEVGHSFGLPHPDIQDELYHAALMGTAYQTYPKAILIPADRAWLSENPFFRYQRSYVWPFTVCKFNDMRPRPTPAPRPPH